MALPDQQATTISCPDCGHKHMIERDGLRFDVFTGQYRSTLQCPQCRRWIYDKRDASCDK